jgi:hypothetical protein
MDYSERGTVLNTSESSVQVQKTNSISILNITLSAKELNVKLSYNGKTLLEFKDRMVENGKLNTFIRTIKNQEYIFFNGELILKKINKQSKFLLIINNQSFISNKFLTMDLETRVINDIMIPYAISIYDGKNSKSFY